MIFIIIIFNSLKTCRLNCSLCPMSDSPATLESSLSPAELVPFQGCVIPPLTPQRDFSPEDSPVNSSTEIGNLPAQDGALWRGIAHCQGRVLGHSMEVNNQVSLLLQRCSVWKSFLRETVMHMIRQYLCVICVMVALNYVVVMLLIYYSYTRNAKALLMAFDKLINTFGWCQSVISLK